MSTTITDPRTGQQRIVQDAFNGALKSKVADLERRVKVLEELHNNYENGVDRINNSPLNKLKGSRSDASTTAGSQ